MVFHPLKFENGKGSSLAEVAVNSRAGKRIGLSGLVSNSSAVWQILGSVSLRDLGHWTVGHNGP